VRALFLEFASSFSFPFLLVNLYLLVSYPVFFWVRKIYCTYSEIPVVPTTAGHHYCENRTPKSGDMDLYQKCRNSKLIVHTKV